MITKEDSRRRWAELRELIWKWDPIGIADFPDWPRDEYDCLVGGVMRKVEDGLSTTEISRFLAAELVSHFGHSNASGAEALAQSAVDWYATTERRLHGE